MISLSSVAEKLPVLNSGVGYSLKDHSIIFLETTDLVNYKNFNIELGYAGRNEESLDEISGVLSYKLVNEGFLNYPILKYFSARVGYYIGYGKINLQDLSGGKIDHGPALTAIISLKF